MGIVRVTVSGLSTVKVAVDVWVTVCAVAVVVGVSVGSLKVGWVEVFSGVAACHVDVQEGVGLDC
jgi:hypothetical protein